VEAASAQLTSPQAGSSIRFHGWKPLPYFLYWISLYDRVLLEGIQYYIISYGLPVLTAIKTLCF